MLLISCLRAPGSSNGNQHGAGWRLRSVSGGDAKLSALEECSQPRHHMLSSLSEIWRLSAQGWQFVHLFPGAGGSGVQDSSGHAGRSRSRVSSEGHFRTIEG